MAGKGKSTKKTELSFMERLKLGRAKKVVENKTKAAIAKEKKAATKRTATKSSKGSLQSSLAKKANVKAGQAKTAKYGRSTSTMSTGKVKQTLRGKLRSMINRAGTFSANQLRAARENIKKAQSAIRGYRNRRSMRKQGVQPFRGAR